MAPRSSHSCFQVLGWKLLHLAIMLSFVQAVVALAATSLLHQVAAGPAGLPNKLHQRYAPDHLGAVASESSVCSEIGIDLLKAGGNAADAVCC
jgi:hypothetical protein